MPDASPKAAEAPKAGAFKRGLLSLNLKFTLATGALLLLLLCVVALVVNEELRSGLTREVGERANTVARNLANKIVDPLIASDDLTLAPLMKGALEEAPAAPAAAQGTLDRIVADLKASFNPASEIKNEGVQEIIITRFPLPPVLQTQYFRYDAATGLDNERLNVQLPPTKAADPGAGEPFPIAMVDGRQVYEVTAPVTQAMDAAGPAQAGDTASPGAAATPLTQAAALSPTADALASAQAASATAAVAAGSKHLGDVRVYLRRDVISDAVRVATTRLLAVMLGSLVAGLILLWLVVRFLFGPVGRLVRGVNAVASGNFGVQIDIRRRDELGDLVDAYNGMAKSLAEKEAVQEALAKYTSKDLVNQMLSDKADLDLGGRKVYATVLFSVVRGMHALSQTLPAEEYVDLINEYLEVESEPIMRNNGSIDKFIGDEVMAVWLQPRDSSSEKKIEAAVQAVTAGVELQHAIERLNAERVKRGDQPFFVSVGINNGEVVSGNMGSSVKMDYTVLGGNVNLAARLGLVAAKGGQVIISESVRDLVADHFKIDVLPPMPLKGIKEPVPLFWPRAVAPGRA